MSRGHALPVNPVHATCVKIRREFQAAAFTPSAIPTKTGGNMKSLSIVFAIVAVLVTGTAFGQAQQKTQYETYVECNARVEKYRSAVAAAMAKADDEGYISRGEKDSLSKKWVAAEKSSAANNAANVDCAKRMGIWERVDELQKQYAATKDGIVKAPPESMESLLAKALSANKVCVAKLRQLYLDVAKLSAEGLKATNLTELQKLALEAGKNQSTDFNAQDKSGEKPFLLDFYQNCGFFEKSADKLMVSVTKVVSERAAAEKAAAEKAAAEKAAAEKAALEKAAAEKAAAETAAAAQAASGKAQTEQLASCRPQLNAANAEYTKLKSDLTKRTDLDAADRRTVEQLSPGLLIALRQVTNAKLDLAGCASASKTLQTYVGLLSSIAAKSAATVPKK